MPAAYRRRAYHLLKSTPCGEKVPLSRDFFTKLFSRATKVRKTNEGFSPCRTLIRTIA